MRLLIIDVNFDYKNIMYRQFYNNLTLEADVSFFGPGYVDSKTLEAGLNDYLNQQEPFDCVMLGVYFVYSSCMGNEFRRNAYSTHRSVLPYYNVSDAYKYCSRILAETEEIENIPSRIYFYYEDSNSMPKSDFKFCERLIQKGWYVMTWPYESMHHFSLKERHDNFFMTNLCIELYEREYEKMIPLTIQAISSHELFYSAYSGREYDWCVPGTRNNYYYPERQRLFDLIKSAGQKIWDKDPYQKVSVHTIEKKKIEQYEFRNKADRLFALCFGKDDFVRSYPNMETIAATRELYLESLRNTKCIFADGSVCNTMLLKHYEVCACGGLLVTTKVDSLDEMGFIDGVNCRVIDKNQIEKSINTVLTAKDNAVVAAAGQKLIREKHMFANRTHAFTEVVEKIKSGNYAGAYWKEGEMILK